MVLDATLCLIPETLQTLEPFLGGRLESFKPTKTRWQRKRTGRDDRPVLLNATAFRAESNFENYCSALDDVLDIARSRALGNTSTAFTT